MRFGDSHTRQKGALQSPLTSFLKKYPSTFAIAAPYAIIVFPVAILNLNPDIGFIAFTAVLALGPTVLIETIRKNNFKRFQFESNARLYGRSLYRLAHIGVLTSSGVGVLAAVSGKGSVAVQAGLAAASGPFVIVDSITSGWVIISICFLCVAYAGGECSRREFIWVNFLALLGAGIEVYLTAITAPFLELVTFIFMLMLLMGNIKPKAAVAALICVLILWPLAFDIRNEARSTSGLIVDARVDANERLRFDKQIARAQELDVPLSVEMDGYLQHPTIVDILRYGIVPRFLDEGRDAVSTGVIINVALGGTKTSAFTFLPVATIYVLEGPLFTLFWYALLAISVGIVWRGGTRMTPMRILLMGLLLYGPLGWFSTYPDKMIGTLQVLISGIPFYLILIVIRIRRNSTKSGRPLV
ncbi:hypothetical protein [Paenarthrobacter ureafaciens]|uniref:hypothetical protein n=1 Tax=Paenarthrobacter ureafaciens TaxID=37931 RepID=UPI0024A38063|nr:hypothetical protein [Paenarthrobacter ureafaciens]GLU61379.1 hypothetical protein Pure01_38920 [Paenarthrobacter ureafaciens]GLU65675.1 hypothetical protein Pure02_39250 [Paenarthrobacter ureafaciens]GLU69988.1 hypothetical protein Pure03_39640 [Paenarthrobacter ureafaciens]GLU74235.1 hypothetical protein Pure04_39500 [Paenarthrobacter ureafaciens]GLU78450.1 hypothetical protein Pure05_38900 [Paenarthrobacter ureafaciens]